MDPQTLSVLASSSVAAIGGMLSKGAEAMVKKAAEDVYSLLKKHLGSKPEAVRALEKHAQQPSEDTQKLLQESLTADMSRDHEFASRLEEALEGWQRATFSVRGGDHSTNIGQIQGNVTFNK